MTTKAEWLALAERFERAKEGSDELDAALATALGWTRKVERATFGQGRLLSYDYDKHLWTSPDGERYELEPPQASTSLDAIAALTEEVLPDCSVLLATACDGRSICNLSRGGLGDSSTLWFDQAKAATEPLARCAALCRAMAERSE